jgi:hypothetical protein
MIAAVVSRCCSFKPLRFPRQISSASIIYEWQLTDYANPKPAIPLTASYYPKQPPPRRNLRADVIVVWGEDWVTAFHGRPLVVTRLMTVWVISMADAKSWRYYTPSIQPSSVATASMAASSIPLAGPKAADSLPASSSAAKCSPIVRTWVRSLTSPITGAAFKIEG